MKGKRAHLDGGKPDAIMDAHRNTFSTSDPYRMEYVDRPDQRRSAKRVEVPRSPLPKMSPNSDWVDAEDSVAPMSKQWESIWLSDTDSVKEALSKRLLLLQQQAVKRIAKAWIKALCPKKQARYPYRSKQQREPDIPEWWNVDLCAHIEPDHVDKEARTKLCLLILRLRPSTEELKKWNGHLYVPNKTLATRGWTAFLQEQTQYSSMLVGLGKSPEPEGKLRLRQKILDDMYYIAGEEERFLKGERDGDIIQMEGYDDAVMASTKKSQAMKRVRDDRDNRNSNTSTKRQKKAKHDAAHETQRRATLEEGFGKIELVEGNTHTRRTATQSGMIPDYLDDRAIKLERKTSRASKSRRQVQTGPNQMMVHTFGLVPEAIPQWHAADPSTSSQGSSPYTFTGSFSSSRSDYDGLGGLPQGQGGPSNFPGEQGVLFEEPEYHQPIMRVYNFTEGPHPQFATVPNTPIVSPINMKFEYGPEVARWQEEYQVAPAMERYPGRFPAQQRFGLAAPGPAAQHMMGPRSDLCTCGPFPEHNHLRSTTPAPEFEIACNGLQTMEYGDGPRHGLPITYYQGYPTPEENGEPVPFAYPGPMPDPDFPAAALPGRVERGFTGNSSGVGGGAMT